MEIIDINTNNVEKHATAVALGNFDGVHIGHKFLLENNIKKAKENNLKSSVFLFSNHTKTILNKSKKSEVNFLTSFKQKTKILEELGIDIVYTMDFDEQIMKLSPEMFVIEILVNRLNAKLVTVGFNYKFGYKAKGDGEYLKKLGQTYGFHVDIMNPIYVDNEIVSSTSIRKLIKAGNIEKANKFLGRSFSLIGTVVRGSSRGRKLGFPTANIKLNDRYVVPHTGVYKTYTTIGSKKFLSLTNIGYNPTFNEDELKIETHILDFNKHIYGYSIKVEFVEFIRDDIKFDTVDDLKNQMKKDLLYIKSKG